MYFYNEDKDDPQKQNALFGHSFDDTNTMNNPFLSFSQSLPSQSFDNSTSFQDDTSPSPSNNQDMLFSQQLNDYNFFDQDNALFSDAHLDPNLLLGAMSNDEQQAILLSDPNFIRQQQLLQEQQQKANKMMMENGKNTNTSSSPSSSVAATATATAPHSNLSAMFNTPSATNNNNTAPKPQLEPVNLITSQEQKKNFVNSQNNRRSISGKSTSPIPLSSSTPNSTTEPTGGIDHQRRFNELQARFRVNYAKKSQKQQQQDDLTGTSMPITYAEQRSFLSSSFTDGTGPSRRKLSLDPTSSKSNRIIREPGKIKVVGGNTGYNSHGNVSGVGKSAAAAMAMPINISNSSTNTPTMARTMPIQIQRVHRANAFQSFDLEQRQKRLDDQLVKVDFEDITVSELKDMLRQRGKPATGKKAMLVQRLQEEREMIQHARANGIPIANRNAQPTPTGTTPSSGSFLVEGSSPVLSSPMMEHAASLPDLSSSPTAVGLGSLNRSIADMHIGSPPMTSQQSRRFAPYSSPRVASTATNNNNNNLSVTGNAELYSSSMPTGSLDMMMMQQHDQQQQMQNQAAEPRVMRGFNFGKKSYAPFASSALATPDREDESNPFDQLEKISENPTHNNNNNNNNTIGDMEWTDPSIELMLQQGGMGGFQDKSADELLSFLAASNPEFDGSQFMYNNQDMLDNNFQNFGGGPDLSSVMFDGYTAMDDQNLHQNSSDNHH
ncbi:hypothetical protein HMPREF1544_04334 [Mucor circinelloides 1006PhL]|uniref:SAP domain-containing protein n=1 Tax=Mucor circinelloides f. circinelloides (strain 1006PhL) TaxID=1220926 RepID=S2K976_MUCC1|nr:hypothetical protein HMPREF1544_04334 [Mucor circinelloides 1006PhL]